MSTQGYSVVTCLTVQVAKHLKDAKPAEIAKHLGDLTYSLVNDPNKVDSRDIPQSEKFRQAPAWRQNNTVGFLHN